MRSQTANPRRTIHNLAVCALALVLAVGLVPVSHINAHAAGTWSAFTVATSGAETYDYNTGLGLLTITEAGTYEVSMVNKAGSYTTDVILINASEGELITVRLTDVSIDATQPSPADRLNEYSHTPIIVKGAGDVKLELSGTNQLKASAELLSGEGYAALQKESTGTLTISGVGAGSLAAYGAGSGAAIGGGKGMGASNIVIESGIITAQAASIGGGAGIGCGANGTKAVTASAITINGGTVTATGGAAGSAGIGGSIGYSGSTEVPCPADGITINGGTVTAEGGWLAAGIGGGRGAAGTNIAINGGALVAVAGTSQDETIGGGAGIGGGYAAQGSVIIAGGTVSATGGGKQGGKVASGLGSGYGAGDEVAAASSVTITGGNVSATASKAATNGTNDVVDFSYTWKGSAYAPVEGQTNAPTTVPETYGLKDVTAVADTVYHFWLVPAEEPQPPAPTKGDLTVVTEVADGYTYADHILTITKPGTYEVSMTTPGTTTTDRIVVNPGAEQTATVILNGVSIDVSGMATVAALSVESGSLVVGLKSSSTLKSGLFRAGLEMTPEATGITVQDTSDDNSGTLSATGGDNAAGIGGGYKGAGKVTVNGGNITATGGKYGAGIGGGSGAGEVIINGGSITAAGGEDGAGIGGGRGGVGEVTVNGGNILATGEKSAAGIGSGYQSVGKVTVNGGNITATGGEYAAGIGGGLDGAGEVTVNGGNITATGGEYAAGIGGGSSGTGEVTVNGGNITATGGEQGAGIGGGRLAAGTIGINGGNVNAKTPAGGAGIGGGSRAAGIVTIADGMVTAKNEAGNTSGIGSGKDAATEAVNNTSIIISGGSVDATTSKTPVYKGDEQTYSLTKLPYRWNSSSKAYYRVSDNSGNGSQTFSFQDMKPSYYKVDEVTQDKDATYYFWVNETVGELAITSNNVDYMITGFKADLGENAQLITSPYNATIDDIVGSLQTYYPNASVEEAQCIATVEDATIRSLGQTSPALKVDGQQTTVGGMFDYEEFKGGVTTKRSFVVWGIDYLSTTSSMWSMRAFEIDAAGKAVGFGSMKLSGFSGSVNGFQRVRGFVKDGSFAVDSRYLNNQIKVNGAVYDVGHGFKPIGSRTATYLLYVGQGDDRRCAGHVAVRNKEDGTSDWQNATYNFYDDSTPEKVGPSELVSVNKDGVQHDTLVTSSTDLSIVSGGETLQVPALVGVTVNTIQYKIVSENLDWFAKHSSLFMTHKTKNGYDVCQGTLEFPEIKDELRGYVSRPFYHFSPVFTFVTVEHDFSIPGATQVDSDTTPASTAPGKQLVSTGDGTPVVPLVTAAALAVVVAGVACTRRTRRTSSRR